MSSNAADLAVLGVPIEFILFAATLLGVALFHHRTLAVALFGLATIIIYKIVFAKFGEGTGVPGLGAPISCTNG